MIVCRFDIKKWHMNDGSISIQLIYNILCKTYNENMLLDDDKLSKRLLLIKKTLNC